MTLTSVSAAPVQEPQESEAPPAAPSETELQADRELDAAIDAGLAILSPATVNEGKDYREPALVKLTVKLTPAERLTFADTAARAKDELDKLEAEFKLEKAARKLAIDEKKAELGTALGALIKGEELRELPAENVFNFAEGLVYTERNGERIACRPMRPEEYRKNMAPLFPEHEPVTAPVVEEVKLAPEAKPADAVLAASTDGETTTVRGRKRKADAKPAEDDERNPSNPELDALLREERNARTKHDHLTN